MKKQKEKEKAKAQAAANKDKPDNTNRPKPHGTKGKASHPNQIKSSKRVEKQLEQIKIIYCHMILKQMRIPKIKVF